jgi:4-nitrophenyl phosphatase
MHPIIEQLDALVLDLDGVIYRGDRTIDGSPEAVRKLREAGKKLLFMTNNSTRHEADVIKKLADHGVVASEPEILTSARVTTDVLISRGLSDRRVLLVGGHGIRSALEGAGFELVDAAQGDRADIVVVGADRSFDYERLRVAADAVRNGAVFIATNSDPTFPTPTGLVPGAGALVAAIEIASGRSAEVIGKPQTPMMEAAAQRLRSADAIGIVGDQPATDLDGGRAMAWTTILVLSGVIEAVEAGLVRPAPDLIVDDLAALVLG